MRLSDRNQTIIELFINTVFVSHDFGILDGIMRDDYIQHNPDVAQGKAGFRQFFEKTFQAIPERCEAS
ncbi:MAG TPA: ester cyclase [Dehalococcoidales bacterium]|nr:ester cyclase [Dehalococcoidales bacterium]